MKLAKAKGIKVLLDGQGADEVAGGYSYFAGAMLWELLIGRRWSDLYRESKLLRERRSINPTSELARVMLGRLPRWLQNRVWSWQRASSSFLVSDASTIVSDLEPPVRSSTNYRKACVLAVNSNLPELLRYEDRSSMAFSIEARVPFLDHRFVEGVLSLPTCEKFQTGWSKYVQRHAFEKDLPQEIVWRRDKMGYKTPQRDWLGKLHPKITSFLRDSNVPAFIDGRKLEGWQGTGESGDIHFTEYWRILLFVKWCHQFSISFV